MPQVASIQVQQIESVERWTPFAVQQLIENAAPFGIQAHEFAINHCALYFEHGLMAAKFLKTLVRIAATRNQFAVSVPDVRQCSKSIMLQFKKEARIIEGLANKGQLGGIHSRRADINMMRSERGGAKRRKGELGSLGATGTLVA